MLESQFNDRDRIKLVTGFRDGFRMGYHGPGNVKLEARNLPFTIGDERLLWNKVMKEVKNERYAGPFDDIPFDFYIQLPIGLVPKDSGKDVQLISHLSHPRLPKEEAQLSLNANTRESECSVHYPDFTDAVSLCIEMGKLNGGVYAYMGKSDFKSAFRNLGISPADWALLVMKARNPDTKKMQYFVDKCLPFDGSISCAHFQLFSDAVAHIFKHRTGKTVVNYLDDFFFADHTKHGCNEQMKEFLKICKEINFPVSMDKTEWATQSITFLGIMIDSTKQKVFIPVEKLQKAEWMIQKFLQKGKARVEELHRLCGLLNFFTKCIIPARTFTRMLYKKLSGYNLKPRHHVPLDEMTKLDMKIWGMFLRTPEAYSRP